MSYLNQTLFSPLTLSVFLVLLLALPVNSSPPKHDLAKKAGDLVGIVSLCQQPVTDVQVYARGTSFSARTDSLGHFKLSYMQKGMYDLVVRNESGIIGTITQIEVIKKKTVNLGVRDFCFDLDGDGYTPPLDCDDANFSINPSATDVCGDAVDNDCSGAADEGCFQCTDIDGDTFFTPIGCGTPLDCNDNNAAINPLAAEQCDGIDNDCDGIIDEEDAFDRQTYYLDNDHDGYGDPSNTEQSCSAPEGYVADGSDCDDGDPNTNPGATEIFGDGIDNDCDGSDDGADFDNDGYISGQFGGDDCNDNDARVYPGSVGYYTVPSGGSFDYNCDGNEDQQFPQRADYEESEVLFLTTCTAHSTGWYGSAPECGQSGFYFITTFELEFGDCRSFARPATQACR